MSEGLRPVTPPGDRAIDAAWQRVSAEEPSARADAAILAAAQAAARGSGQPGPASRAAHGRRALWRAMAAAAAVAGLALLLVPRTERQERMLTAPTQDNPTESAQPANEAVPADVPAPDREAASAEMPAPPAAAPAAKMQSVAPQATGPSTAAETGPVEAQTRAETAGPGTATARSRAVTAGGVDGSAGSASPQEWIDRVATLHAAGDMAAAAAALQEFRRAFPDADAQLPPELRAWAAAVPQQP